MTFWKMATAPARSHHVPFGGFEKNLREGLLSAMFRAGSYLLDY